MIRIYAYCDGSYDPKETKSGFGSFLLIKGVIQYTRKGIEYNSNSLRSEINAIIITLNSLRQYIVDNPNKKYKIQLFSDSLTCIDILNDLENIKEMGWLLNRKDFKDGKMKYKPIKNQDLWEFISGLLGTIKYMGQNVKFKWVKGHSSSNYNKIAHSMANEARKNL